MKLNIVNIKENGLSCWSEDCRFRKECANHVTAGDFRMEGGFSPKITVTKSPNGEISIDCASADAAPTTRDRALHEWPVGHEEQGYVSIHNAVLIGFDLGEKACPTCRNLPRGDQPDGGEWYSDYDMGNGNPCERCIRNPGFKKDMWRPKKVPL